MHLKLLFYECSFLQSGDEYILPMSSDASLTFAQ